MLVALCACHDAGLVGDNGESNPTAPPPRATRTRGVGRLQGSRPGLRRSPPLPLLRGQRLPTLRKCSRRVETSYPTRSVVQFACCSLVSRSLRLRASSSIWRRFYATFTVERTRISLRP